MWDQNISHTALHENNVIKNIPQSDCVNHYGVHAFPLQISSTHLGIFRLSSGFKNAENFEEFL